MNWPKLYHMAEEGSWSSIRKIGLLSTTELLKKCNVGDRERASIESKWREDGLRIPCGEHGSVYIRDQIPMEPGELRKCLNGMSPDEWYQFINGKVFFWTTMQDLQKFLSATHYRNKPHVVITVDTKAIVNLFFSSVSLSPINSGSTFYDPNKYAGPRTRNRNTFEKILDYRFDWIKELAIDGGIPDIISVALRVDRVIAHKENYLDDPSYEILETIWDKSTDGKF